MQSYHERTWTTCNKHNTKAKLVSWLDTQTSEAFDILIVFNNLTKIWVKNIHFLVLIYLQLLFAPDYQ